jgi:putative GTP pyrophosphokinase
MDYVRWYSENLGLHSSLLDDIKQLLENLLTDKDIRHLPIQVRVKTLDSFIQKMTRNGYTSPEQVSDLAGSRVIGFKLSDVDKINKVIESNFKVDDAENKLEKLGEDKVGYLSTHYVVSISKDRANLPEYRKYNGMKLEIQVRTILQHAWAELDHDRNYKFAGELTTDLKREFSLLAGLLEYADRGFQRLSDDIERYSNEITQKTKEGNLNMKIDPITIKSYFNERYPDAKSDTELIGKDTIDELKSKGVSSISDLNIMISKTKEKYQRLSQITHKPFSRIAVADIYNSRDKSILRPKFLKAVYDLSSRNDRICVDAKEALRNTGLGGYLEGIIPYVVADLEEDGLIKYCENRDEIRLTQKGKDETRNNVTS